jgi:crotonobetainyl-CoA:carnitine CoA-transferase CaiB-like acyl-CoA transferase
MGWGWDVLREVNPRLVMVSMPGWGAKGPYQGYVTLGSGLDASSGHTSVRGYPGHPPEDTQPIFHSDATGALTLIFAALTALRRRDATGEGMFVDLSQIEAMTWQLPGLLAEYTFHGRVAQPLGNDDPHIVPHAVYRAAGEDQWVFVAAEDDAQWAALAQALGHLEWAQDGHPWASVPGRLRARADVDAAIEAFTRERNPHEAADAIQAAGAIAAPVVNSPTMATSPQLLARDWFRFVTHRYAGTNMMPGFIWRVAPDAPSWDRPSGLVGEHNDEVLAEIGLTREEIEALERDGVIGRAYGAWATPAAAEA